MSTSAIIMMGICFVLVFGGFIVASLRLQRISKRGDDE